MLANVTPHVTQSQNVPYTKVKNLVALAPVLGAILRPAVCFAELTLTSLIRISALNPKSRHYVTVATPRAVPGRRAKAFIWRTVVPLARVTLPVEVRQLAHPSCLAPRVAFLVETVGWILERNKLNVSSARITRGEGCLGYPGPYKWGVRGFVEKLCLHTEIACEPLGDKGLGNLLNAYFDRKKFILPWDISPTFH